MASILTAKMLANNAGVFTRINLTEAWAVKSPVAPSASQSIFSCNVPYYLPLLTYLDSVHQHSFFWARFNQEGMWQAFIHSAPFGGITAMPSLHIAGVTLFAIAARALNRRLGTLFVTYAVVILLGSVHLGWHYARDGYASIVLTLTIWRLVSWALDKAGWISLAQEEEMVRLKQCTSASHKTQPLSLFSHHAIRILDIFF
jgi:hypothetical protein